MKTKVLLVDDDEEFSGALTQELVPLGFAVTVAPRGDAALELLLDTDFDVVIMSVQIPGTDCLELLREIKRIKPLVEVLTLSTRPTLERAIQGMKFGAYDFVLKASDTGELVEKIRRAYALKLDHEGRIKRAEMDHIVESRGR